MKKWILFSISCMLLIGCKKDEVVEQAGPSGIDIMEMEVGQFNLYHAYTGENYYKPEGVNDYTYVDDTLKVEIIDKNGEEYLWKESYTPGSKSVVEEETEALKEFTYWVSIDVDSIQIREAVEDTYYSHFLYGFYLNTWYSTSGKFKIPLNPAEKEETNVEGWKTTSSYHEGYKEYYDPETIIKGKNYGKTHVIADNVPMQLDGNGKTYVFNREHGLIRTFTYSWWTSTGTGFDLIPD